jgi:hypothetical protein
MRAAAGRRYRCFTDALGQPDSQPEQQPILITGTTGFVGMEVLARFLQRSQRHIFALIRPGNDAEANERLRAVLATTFGDPDAHPGRVTAVAGDIEHSGLGLDSGRLDEVAGQVDRVLHAAASVSFELGIARLSRAPAQPEGAGRRGADRLRSRRAVRAVQRRAERNLPSRGRRPPDHSGTPRADDHRALPTTILTRSRPGA